MSNKKFDNIDNEFKNLVKKEKLNINTIEDIMLKDIDDYKIQLQHHIEELLASEIDEKNLVAKKNKNGKKKDIH